MPESVRDVEIMDRQFEIKDRAALRVRLRPQSPLMRADDGAADGEAHTEPVRLRGVKGSK